MDAALHAGARRIFVLEPRRGGHRSARASTATVTAPYEVASLPLDEREVRWVHGPHVNLPSRVTTAFADRFGATRAF